MNYGECWQFVAAFDCEQCKPWSMLTSCERLSVTVSNANSALAHLVDTTFYHGRKSVQIFVCFVFVTIPDTIIWGGSKLEVVFPHGSSCELRVSWVDYNSLRLSQLQSVSQMAAQQTRSSYAVHNCKSDFSIDLDCPRHVKCRSLKKPRWAIIAEVTKITQISVVYWLIL